MVLRELLEAAVNLTIYEPKDEFYHKLNPITKLYIIITSFLYGLILTGVWISLEGIRMSPIYMFFYTVFVLAFLVATGKSVIREIWKRRFAVVFILVMIGIGNFLLGSPYRVAQPWYVWGFIEVSDISLIYGISKTLFLVSVMFSAIAFFKATNPRELTDSLERKGLPYRFSFLISSILRFIPMVAEKFFVTFNAHMVRGVELEKGSMREKINNLRLLFAPMILDILKTVDRMTMVLHARGFSVTAENRTTIVETKFSAADYAVLAIFTVAIVTAMYLAWMHGFYLIWRGI